MNYSEKLKIIISITGKTQENLAHELGVTFASLNRWINGKAKPRLLAQDKINSMLVASSGVKGIYSVPHKQDRDLAGIRKSNLFLKEEAVRMQNKKYPHIIDTILNNPDIRDQLVLSLTYHSNKIEGSTLSEAETASIIFHNIALKNKTLTEQIEAKNHQAALLHMFNHVKDQKPLDEAFIMKIHSILMNGIMMNAGEYRNHGVRIVGSFVPTANYLKIPELMKGLSKRMNADLTTDASGSGKGATAKTSRKPGEAGGYIRACARFHAEFEQIHPFSDGSGRTGRILLNAMLLRQNLAPAVIVQNKKIAYYKSLSTAQLKGEFEQIEEYIADAVIVGYRLINREIVRW